MATRKIYVPWNTKKLGGLFANNGQPFNKNKLALLTLILVASAALTIFAVNIIKLVNSDTPVKTTMITERQKTAPIKKTGIESWEAVPIATSGTGPLHPATQAVPIATTGTESLHPAHQAVPVEAISIQTATQAAPAPQVKSTERFTIDNYLYRAREYEMKGEYSKALANYKQVLNMEENNFLVMNNISYIYLHLDLFKESIEYSIRAININRDYVPALTNMGIAYAKTGDLSTAEYHFTRALKLEPANQDVILNLALLFERQGSFSEASEHYLRLVKLGNISGALGLGRIYEKEGRTSEAISFYKKIYESDSIDNKTRAFVRKRILVLQNNQMKTAK